MSEFFLNNNDRLKLLLLVLATHSTVTHSFEQNGSDRITSFTEGNDTEKLSVPDAKLQGGAMQPWDEGTNVLNY